MLGDAIAYFFIILSTLSIVLLISSNIDCFRKSFEYIVIGTFSLLISIWITYFLIGIEMLWLWKGLLSLIIFDVFSFGGLVFGKIILLKKYDNEKEKSTEIIQEGIED
jgi:hypothetical protein